MFRVTSSCRHAVATTPVGSQGIHRSVFRLSAGGTRPHDSSLRRQITGSAPTLRISRLAQRSLLLRPVDSLTPQGSFFLKCFSPIRYLLEPPQVLPTGATSRRAGFAPAGNNTTFHGTQFDFRHENPGMRSSGNSAIVLGAAFWFGRTPRTQCAKAVSKSFTKVVEMNVLLTWINPNSI